MTCRSSQKRTPKVSWCGIFHLFLRAARGTSLLSLQRVSRMHRKRVHINCMPPSPSVGAWPPAAGGTAGASAAHSQPPAPEPGTAPRHRTVSPRVPGIPCRFCRAFEPASLAAGLTCALVLASVLSTFQHRPRPVRTPAVRCGHAPCIERALCVESTPARVPMECYRVGNIPSAGSGSHLLALSRPPRAPLRPQLRHTRDPRPPCACWRTQPRSSPGRRTQGRVEAKNPALAAVQMRRTFTRPWTASPHSSGGSGARAAPRLSGKYSASEVPYVLVVDADLSSPPHRRAGGGAACRGGPRWRRRGRR